MNSKKHRLGVDEVNLVVRRLRLDIHNLKNLPDALTEIDGLFGLDEVEYRVRLESIVLKYDPTHLSLQEIETILNKYEIRLHNDWWTHFKEEHYFFVDENIRVKAGEQPKTICFQPKLKVKKYAPHRPRSNKALPD